MSYEYLVMAMPSEARAATDMLNQWADEGWRVVAVDAYPPGASNVVLERSRRMVVRRVTVPREDVGHASGSLEMWR